MSTLPISKFVAILILISSTFGCNVSNCDEQLIGERHFLRIQGMIQSEPSVESAINALAKSALNKESSKVISECVADANSYVIIRELVVYGHYDPLRHTWHRGAEPDFGSMYYRYVAVAFADSGAHVCTNLTSPPTGDENSLYSLRGWHGSRLLTWQAPIATDDKELAASHHRFLIAQREFSNDAAKAVKLYLSSPKLHGYRIESNSFQSVTILWITIKTSEGTCDIIRLNPWNSSLFLADDPVEFSNAVKTAVKGWQATESQFGKE